MTCIAWDGKTLAADKMSSDGSNHFTVTKIIKHKNLLIGFAGVTGLGYAMRQWVMSGCKVDDFPALQATDEYVSMIIVSKPKKGKPVIMVYDTTPFPYQIEDKFYAIGSGKDFALASMHLGKTSKEAVEIACHFSRSCGNGIDTLSF